MFKALILAALIFTSCLALSPVEAGSPKPPKLAKAPVVVVVPPTPAECAGMTFDKVIVAPSSIAGMNVVGTMGRDLIFTSANTMQVVGYDGDDCIVGLFPGVMMDGGNGNDVLLGAPGNGYDRLNGGAGDDYLDGGGSTFVFPDLLNGGSGTDTCVNGQPFSGCEL